MLQLEAPRWKGSEGTLIERHHHDSWRSFQLLCAILSSKGVSIVICRWARKRQKGEMGHWDIMIMSQSWKRCFNCLAMLQAYAVLPHACVESVYLFAPLNHM